MQVKIDLKIFIFALIFIFTKQISLYAFLMIFALIHECGHLLAGIAVGLKPESIQIAPYGFSIGFKTNVDDYNKKIKNASILSLKKIIIASAGPFVNLLIILIVYIYYVCTKNIYLFGIGLDMIIYSNILICVFNLIPIYPLDGGRILKELIHIYHGIWKAHFYTNEISNISIIVLTAISSVLILMYKNIAILIVLVYLWVLILKENKREKNTERILKNYCKNI